MLGELNSKLFPLNHWQLINKIYIYNQMWRKIRRIPPSTLKDLHTYLLSGINTRTSKGSRAQLLKWAPYFKLFKGKMILETNIPPPDLVDPTT